MSVVELGAPLNGPDLIWARHVLEHVQNPIVALIQIYKELNSGGTFYMEVPAPGQRVVHENNLNHFSVLGKRMWASLLKRVGFEDIEVVAIHIGSKDKYYKFIAKKGQRWT